MVVAVPAYGPSCAAAMVVLLKFSCQVHCPYLLLCFFAVDLGTIGCRGRSCRLFGGALLHAHARWLTDPDSL
jgi:hypothetical protein